MVARNSSRQMQSQADTQQIKRTLVELEAGPVKLEYLETAAIYRELFRSALSMPTKRDT